MCWRWLECRKQKKKHLTLTDKRTAAACSSAGRTRRCTPVGRRDDGIRCTAPSGRRTHHIEINRRRRGGGSGGKKRKTRLLIVHSRARIELRVVCLCAVFVYRIYVYLCCCFNNGINVMLCFVCACCCGICFGNVCVCVSFCRGL